MLNQPHKKTPYTSKQQDAAPGIVQQHVLMRKILSVLSMLLLLFFARNAFAADSDDFVITVKTDNAGTSLGTQFTIRTFGSGYNYNVDCNNDGSNELTGQTGAATCDYSTAGTYTIRIKDANGDGTGFPQIHFDQQGDKLKLVSIDQ